MLTNECPIHTLNCCEGPCAHEVETEPTEEELVQELVAHLKGKCPNGACSYCYEEQAIRHMGQENYDAMEAHYEAEAKELCTC